MGFSRRAFSVLWVVVRSRSQRRRVGVVGPYHRRRHRSDDVAYPVVPTESANREGLSLGAFYEPHMRSEIPPC